MVGEGRPSTSSHGLTSKVVDGRPTGTSPGACFADHDGTGAIGSSNQNENCCPDPVALDSFLPEARWRTARTGLVVVTETCDWWTRPAP